MHPVRPVLLDNKRANNVIIIILNNSGIFALKSNPPPHMDFNTKEESTPRSSPSNIFISDFKTLLERLFHEREPADRLALQRGIPPYLLREILQYGPLSAAIPTKHGGRGGHVAEMLSVLETASYESLALSLTLGINMALFLQPFANYADEQVKSEVFQGFLVRQKMGGLMITEPGHGSDALHMQTRFSEEEGRYHLVGTKHWAGLTGWADYWLLTARRETRQGTLSRDLDIFLCDTAQPGQHIVVEERFNNLGLYMIPYGRNYIDVKVPVIHRLQPRTTGVKMLLDLLHHSRMMMPGTGLGFIRRNLDEALLHARQRKVGGHLLIRYDQVQSRIAAMQAAYTICSAMCVYSSNTALSEVDLSGHGFEANIIKTVVSDLMQDTAQSLLQMHGANGYRLDHYAGRATVDSRPFPIFEGSNDILYQQITEHVQKSMKQHGQRQLCDFLRSHPVTAETAELTCSLTQFDPAGISQRKQVSLGRAIARIFAIGFVDSLASAGFGRELTSGAISWLVQETGMILAGYQSTAAGGVVEDYRETGSWGSLVNRKM